MTFNTSGGDAFWDLGDDQRQQFQQFTHQMSSNQQHMASTSGHSSPQSSHGAMPAQRIWPMPLDMSSGAIEHSSPPESHHQHHHQHHSSSPAQSASPLSQSSPYQQPGSMLTDFALQQHLQQHQQSTPDFSSYISDPFMPVTYDSFASNFAPINPISYLPATTQQLPTNFLQAAAFNSMPPMDDSVPAMTWPNLPMDNWQDLQAAVPPMQLGSLPHTVGSSSPTGTFLEVLSLASSNEGSWIMVGDQNNAGSFNQFQQAQQNAAIFNPGQTLHLRTNSDSSDGANSFELGSYEEIPPFPISNFSPGSDSRARKGEPCGGCQPSHARLWQVPCTRIDIKDINYFLKGWKVDYERHTSRNVSVFNVKGFSPNETLMWITHGYGFALPVYVREVYVNDESVFQVDWVESHLTDQEPIEFDIRTDRLDVGAKGVSVDALSAYLDKHIDGPFEEFIDDHFEGTPFITEILKTAHRFYVKEKMPVIRKALKLVLAYNLTMHITMIQQQGDEAGSDGQIDDEDSKFYGQTVAPVMVNFQIKCALADMWRELQRDILEELSSLYSSVYSGERLKNWPTIFMLASILLAVWEEMQFDSHYRMPDPAAVNKFCTDMETTPVGVIVGLFHAISQKLPAFTEWDTAKHGHILNNNTAVCEAMTEVREHVRKHEDYLRARPECTFDRNDFDCLSNKFLSKLVIRAN
ncbi:conserved hypothetical protein [Verticillium alfalfae VaMs.102]|uniref:C6 finger domain-containing protein n=1 Tax=Verticillium alfalfae (strain VaMs.102 / ATCC MYA-4576 / FGSC 10136) TaxID=526221 RepID=C9SSZ8_VERA1|nr:conserved hypothetical protein [Verticillium alfalfae VaMs.102]EEY21913.1 conserved hypothetical protein [Verticillium alfalfae VaMs.102]